MSTAPRFSEKTIRFLRKAARQKDPEWLEKHRDEYQDVLLAPLQGLARHLQSKLRGLAPDYHFPQKGIGRLKRPSNRVNERGGDLYREWMTYAASRPRKSRFEHNPNLFFLINSDDSDDPVLVAGGLYMPSSKQLRALREAIARDASAFDELFRSKAFARCFKGGFSSDKISSRSPRGFDPLHPRMNWLRLQAYFVWRPYSRREFGSKNFPQLVERDWTQILRLNRLLEKAVEGRLPVAVRKSSRGKRAGLLDKLEDLEITRREMDF